MKIEMRFTPVEAEVLQHRITIPDAIADVFGPDNDNLWGLVPERVLQKVEYTIKSMVQPLTGGGMIIAFSPADKDQVEVLNEIVDGNTMPSVSRDMIENGVDRKTKAQGVAYREAMERINTKFENAGLSGRLPL